jgi:hypothetical protein
VTVRRPVAVIQTGQEWRIGEHVVACLDICSDQYIRWQSRFDLEAPKAMYADPPWNDGVIKQAYQLANLPWPPNYGKLMGQVWRIGRHFQIPTYVEASVRSASQASVILGHLGGHLSGTIDLRYTKERKSKLLIAGWDAVTQVPVPQRAEGFSVHNAPGVVFADAIAQGVLQRGDRVLDPVCGPDGATALGCVRFGLRFVGCEINPVRAEHVVELLARLTGDEPKLGRLL